MSHHRSDTGATPTLVRRSNEREAIERLRAIFFAAAGDAVIRYAVSFDDVLIHIRAARRAGRQVLLRNVGHVDDLVHAVACTRMVPVAWTDLADRYERQVVRRCRHRVDEITATVLTRRMFASLRLQEQSLRVGSGKGSLLRAYVGTRPLRTWLADHTLSQISHACTASGNLVSACTSAASWWKIHGVATFDAARDDGDEEAVVLRFPAAAVGS